MAYEVHDGYQKFRDKESLILEPEDWSSQEWATICKLFGLPLGQTERIVLHTSEMECYVDLIKKVLDGERTYTVTEMCPHCESEVEMRWNTDTQGFKAFCPACGKRLMLCDECHQLGGGCDYDSKTDSCRFNPSVAHPEIPSSLRIETPLGAIIVRPAHDPEYPGVFVDLRRTDADQDLLLALVEFTETEGDLPGTGHVITRVYGDALSDEYTDRIVHHGIEDYFRVEEVEGNE